MPPDSKLSSSLNVKGLVKMKHLLFCLIFHHAFEEFPAIEFTQKKLTVHFDKFLSACPGVKVKTPMTYNNYHVKYVGAVAFINYDVVIKENIPENLKVSVGIERCKSREALDSCVTFTTIHSKKFCEMSKKSTDVWSSFDTCVRPPLWCPLKNVTYKARNCKLDIESFTTFSLEGYYWKFRVDLNVIDPPRLINCALVHGYVKRINVKNRH